MMSAAFFSFLGLLGLSSIIVTALPQANEEDDENLNSGPNNTNESTETFSPNFDENALPPAASPNDNLRNYSDEEGTPTVELTLSTAFINSMHAGNPADYTSYAAFVDLQDSLIEFAFSPPQVAGDYFLAHFSHEEPTDTEDVVEKSLHMELLYSASGETPTRAQLLGSVESDLFVLAYVDLGQALFDTAHGVFVSGYINDQPLLSESLQRLKHIRIPH